MSLPFCAAPFRAPFPPLPYSLFITASTAFDGSAYLLYSRCVSIGTAPCIKCPSRPNMPCKLPAVSSADNWFAFSLPVASSAARFLSNCIIRASYNLRSSSFRALGSYSLAVLAASLDLLNSWLTMAVALSSGYLYLLSSCLASIGFTQSLMYGV